MRKSLSRSLSLVMLVIALLSSAMLAACTSAVTSASCAFVVGDGQDGRNANLHTVIWPGQNPDISSTDVVTYVPCNSRNYIITNGVVQNANKEQIGDRSVPITATTSTGVNILIQARVLWTLNENKQAMDDFFNVCFKYTCASQNDVGGSVNSATSGWNKMLGENFGLAMDLSARIAAYNSKIDDSIWRTHSPQQYQILSDLMVPQFGILMQKNLGYSENLVCGSGNSKWPDPNNPGKGNFTCLPVRIVVEDVQLSKDQGIQGQAELSKQRLDNAKALYGSNAGFWLAIMDAIDHCRSAGATCVFNFGGSGSIPVVTPQK